MTSLRLFSILSLGLLTACSSFGFPRKPTTLSSTWELVWSDNGEIDIVEHSDYVRVFQR